MLKTKTHHLAYLLSQLLEYEDINYSVFDNEIIEGKKFSSYICEIYSTNMDYYRVIKNTENLDDIYFLNFCMTILQVGSDIKQIDENIDLVNDEFIVNLENNEIIVNQTINTILEKYDE